MILNNVQLIGNLTADPQTRTTPKGHPVVDIRLGVNEPYETETGERRQVTTFVNVRFWGPSGQHLAELARKGVEVFVEGKLRENRWVDSATDEERSMLYLKGSWWQFTQYRTPRPAPQPEPTPQPAPEAPAPAVPAPEPAAPEPSAPAAAEPSAASPAAPAKRKVAKRAKPASA
jgi:single stranded DNA-binding protein